MVRLVAFGLMQAMVVVAAVPAAAQPSSHTRGWASFRFLGNIDGTHGLDSVHTTMGWGLATGLESDRAGIELTADWPRPFVVHKIQQYRDPQLGPIRNGSDESKRSKSWSALGAVTPFRQRRIRVTLTFGGMFVAHEWRLSGYQERLTLNSEVLSRKTFAHGGKYRWLGIAYGLRVPLALTRQLSVVPELQGAFFLGSETGSSILRPAIGARWTF